MQVIEVFTQEELDKEIRKLSVCAHEACEAPPDVRVEAVDVIGARISLMLCVDCARSLHEQIVGMGGRCLFVPLPPMVAQLAHARHGWN